MQKLCNLKGGKDIVVCGLQRYKCIVYQMVEGLEFFRTFFIVILELQQIDYCLIEYKFNFIELLERQN